jgi:hypothetical protein
MLLEWIEKVIISMTCVSAEKVWVRSARPKGSLTKLERSIFDVERAHDIVKWTAMDNGGAIISREFGQYQKDERNMRFSRRLQTHFYDTVRTRSSLSFSAESDHTRQFGAAALAQPVLCPIDKGHAMGRSKLFSKLAAIFKAHFDERLDSDGKLELYQVTLDDDDVDALAHWREASHAAHKTIITTVARRLLGSGARNFVRDWFIANEPRWVCLSELPEAVE